MLLSHCVKVRCCYNIGCSAGPNGLSYGLHAIVAMLPAIYCSRQTLYAGINCLQTYLTVATERPATGNRAHLRLCATSLACVNICSVHPWIHLLQLVPAKKTSPRRSSTHTSLNTTCLPLQVLPRSQNLFWHLVVSWAHLHSHLHPAKPLRQAQDLSMILDNEHPHNQDCN